MENVCYATGGLVNASVTALPSGSIQPTMVYSCGQHGIIVELGMPYHCEPSPGIASYSSSYPSLVNGLPLTALFILSFLKNIVAIRRLRGAGAFLIAIARDNAFAMLVVRF